MSNIKPLGKVYIEWHFDGQFFYKDDGFKDESRRIAELNNRVRIADKLMWDAYRKKLTAGMRTDALVYTPGEPIRYLTIE